jgi:glycosyltransferase involved in cell wall biosynthesis
VVDHNHDLLRRVRAELAGVIAVGNSGVRGLSSARNTGIGAATGSIIAFMDDDAVADPGWLAAIISRYADPSVIGVGGSIEPLWVHGRPPWFPQEFDWVVGCTYHGMPRTTSPVRNLIGCNMSFRRETFIDAEPFRVGVGRRGGRPLGCEETLFCIALAQQRPHQKVLYEPEARVLHRVPPERRTWRYFRARCYAEGRSKALISGLVGAADSLSTERCYTVQTLPRGVLTALSDAARHRNGACLARSAAIVAGVAMTAAGFAVGRLSQSVRPASAPLTSTIATADRSS